MEYYFITGTSRGIGNALAIALLEKGHFVYGIGRNNFINHTNYKHIFLDLSNSQETSAFNFPKVEDASKIVLVNNAGTLGDINHVGEVTNESLVNAFTINLIGPALLTNNFVKSYKAINVSKIILNIGSGASQYPYDGWGAYCSTKAGVDMWSKVVAEEQKINGQGFNILSVAPGIIATKMQEQIRATDASGFSNLSKFIESHEQNLLKSPQKAADELIKLLSREDLFHKVVLDIRDIQ